MTHPPEAIEALRARGVRITPQREAVLCALYSLGGHVTAEDVYEAVCQNMFHVGLATVYRNLDVLRQLGVVAATDLGDGRLQWELTVNGPHHHAVCRKCGAVTQLDDTFVQELAQKLQDELDFEADLSHMAFFGTCAECRNKADTP